jgi:hypothetical protein
VRLNGRKREPSAAEREQSHHRSQPDEQPDGAAGALEALLGGPEAPGFGLLVERAAGPAAADLAVRAVGANLLPRSKRRSLVGVDTPRYPVAAGFIRDAS